MAWDKYGNPSPWSQLASWEMGLLDPGDWQARWITLAAKPSKASRRMGNMPYWIWHPDENGTFRWLTSLGLKNSFKAEKGSKIFWRSFVVTAKNFKSAVFVISADDKFEAYLNGQKAGEGSNWRQFSVIDLAPFLKTGLNLVKIEATNSGGNAGLVGQIQIELDDSSKIIIPTNSLWRSSSVNGRVAPVRTLAHLGGGPWGDRPSHRLLGPNEMLPAPYLRREFSIQKAVKSARIYATALGLYEIYLNGRRVSDVQLAPGWSDYKKRVYYQTYDVTGLLRQGSNALGVILGDGWYAGYVGWATRRYLYGGETPRLLLQLEVDYGTGEREILTSDSTWKGRTGPILYSDLQEGEFYDARLELGGWSLAGYEDRSWDPVDTFNFHKGYPGLIEAQPDEPIKVIEILKPVKITRLRRHTFIIDFGQNIAGRIQMKVQGSSGTLVTIKHGEMLNSDGTLYTANLRQASATDKYNLKGGTQEKFEPRFTYHGFKYVEVSGYPGIPQPDSFEAHALHSSLEQTGHFASSDARLNRLYQNILWSQRGNFVGIPTDCPSRDERLGWGADALLFARTASYLEDTSAFFEKWMKDFRDGQDKNGAYCDVAPCILREGRAAPGWGDAGVFIPWTMFQHYGNLQILEDNFDSMKRWIEYVRQANPGLIWNHQMGENFGDWLSPGPETPKELVATAFFARSSQIVADASRVLGRNDDAAYYDNLAAHIRQAFAKEFLRKSGEIKGDTQTGYALALGFDLIDEEDRRQTARRLIKAIEKIDWKLSTGFVGTSLLLPTLSQAGYPQAAFRLLLSEKYPSWLFQIAQGATTVWERWDGWTPQGGFHPDVSMNSFNHYAFGSVGEWLFTGIGGIESIEPGFRRLRLCPKTGGGLSHVKVIYQSVRGKIMSDWKIKNGKLTWKISIPPGVTAVACLPENGLREGGRKTSEAQGLSRLEGKTEEVNYSIESGNYIFTAIALPEN